MYMIRVTFSRKVSSRYPNHCIFCYYILMRKLFVISIILVCIIAWLNLFFVPSRYRQAKEIVDRHLHLLPLADIEEITYVGNLSLFRNQVSVNKLYVKAKSAHWSHVKFSDVILEIDCIDYDAKAAFWRKRRTINAITGIKFTGFVSYDEISSKLAEGKITFEEFLKETSDYLKKGKVVGNEKTLDQPNMGDMAGGKTPSDTKPEKSLSESYGNDLY